MVKTIYYHTTPRVLRLVKSNGRGNFETSALKDEISTKKPERLHYELQYTVEEDDFAVSQWAEVRAKTLMEGVYLPAILYQKNLF